MNSHTSRHGQPSVFAPLVLPFGLLCRHAFPINRRLFPPIPLFKLPIPLSQFPSDQSSKSFSFRGCRARVRLVEVKCEETGADPQ